LKKVPLIPVKGRTEGNIKVELRLLEEVVEREGNLIKTVCLCVCVCQERVIINKNLQRLNYISTKVDE
jgi:hypothetical protein